MLDSQSAGKTKQLRFSSSDSAEEGREGDRQEGQEGEGEGEGEGRERKPDTSRPPGSAIREPSGTAGQPGSEEKSWLGTWPKN